MVISVYNGFVFACSSSVRLIMPVGDVSLPLAGRYGYLFLSPFFPAISFLVNLVFGKDRLAMTFC